jgi:hypothetical protein
MSLSVAAWAVGGLAIARLAARKDLPARSFLLLASVFLLAGARSTCRCWPTPSSPPRWDRW